MKCAGKQTPVGLTAAFSLFQVVKAPSPCDGVEPDVARRFHPAFGLDEVDSSSQPRALLTGRRTVAPLRVCLVQTMMTTTATATAMTHPPRLKVSHADSRAGLTSRRNRQLQRPRRGDERKGESDGDGEGNGGSDGDAMSHPLSDELVCQVQASSPHALDAASAIVSASRGLTSAGISGDGQGGGGQGVLSVSVKLTPGELHQLAEYWEHGVFTRSRNWATGLASLASVCLVYSVCANTWVYHGPGKCHEMT
ncbi:unnamed protein product [Protopolystoma xenopodis]|uniref:Uncharacterized protein n=1 Tax=Protopolystoma xenopodis TaxID=117903 RepID=A0A448WZK1_9PLAT|nr:unnamed protein product [Protopolystoma xenopodis]